MIDEPRIVQTSTQEMACIHITTPREKIQEVMGPGYMELMETLKAQGAAPSGPWFTHHLKMDPEIFDFEICLPVLSPVQPAGRMLPGQLRAARVARTVHHGGYEGLSDAWMELEAWIKNQGQTSAPDLWEIYLTGPEMGSDSSKWQTELNRPLN